MARTKRITINPNYMGGLACSRGVRIPVATVVGMVSQGMTEAEAVAQSLLAVQGCSIKTKLTGKSARARRVECRSRGVEEAPRVPLR